MLSISCLSLLALRLRLLVFHSTTILWSGVIILQSECICPFHLCVSQVDLCLMINFRWWPEIPVIISIILSTAIMGSLCYRVYQNEKRSARYTGGETRLSAMLFKQSCWFVIAFYITWVPYLTLQVCTWQIYVLFVKQLF